MKRRVSCWYLAVLACGSQHLAGAPLAAPSRIWRAYWIDAPGSMPQAYGVYDFRRTLELAAKPDHFAVRVSGDNRYQLFVNGERVAAGPARGDLTHWRYETVDIAAQLVAGKNTIAAIVWNDGTARAVAQITNQTGFLLESVDEQNSAADTNKFWKVQVDRAYTQQFVPRDQITGYYALPPNEHFDARAHSWGWEKTGYDDTSWSAAHEFSHGADREASDAPNRWMLVPSEIPPEERKPESPLKIREAVGFQTPAALGGTVIPARTHATLLLDQGYLTTAYPELNVSGGKGALISLHYAEALFTRAGKTLIKEDRDITVNKVFLGPSDTYVSDGAPGRSYVPLFWRTYRYLQLEVTAADTPLTLNDVRGDFTAYPFHLGANFAAAGSPQNVELQRIFATGWRTARLCAHETYMDCPFYEQLQYAGDARIQMMISLYMTGDSRLMKNGIGLLDSSRTAEGATLSRAPSQLPQYIPPFSLWWIGMVEDYSMYVDDPTFVRQMLPGVRAILAFFARYQKENGSLGRLPWWNFVDWVDQWPGGVPPGDPDGTSASALDLQLLLALQWGTRLEREFGSRALASLDEAAAAKLTATIRTTDWDESRGLVADQPSHKTYSQHVNSLAVLAHVVEGAKARSVVDQMLSDKSLTQASIYFRAYTNAALSEAGLGDRFLDLLGPWHHMLENHLTTWAEWDQPNARSDCHAWGASPNFELLRTVAGIRSDGIGFRRVRIAPNLGALPHVVANMPHPKGEIQVDLEKHGTGLQATVSLPKDTTGTFEWKGHEQPLHAGENRLTF